MIGYKWLSVNAVFPGHLEETEPDRQLVRVQLIRDDDTVARWYFDTIGM